MLKSISWLLKKKRYVIAAVLILGIGGYFGYKHYFGQQQTTSYVTAKVERGTLLTTVSGSGQIAASSQVDIKAKSSGSLISMTAVAGKEVRANTLLASIDASDAYKAVRDAETSLETARLTLDKLKAPTDALTLLQSENSLIQAKETKQSAEDSLVKTREDGFNTVADVFLDMPSLISGLYSIIYNNNISVSYWNIDWYANQGTLYNPNESVKIRNYRDLAVSSYLTARQNYDANFESYKNASRASADATIEALISETYRTVSSMAEAVKNLNNFIDFVQDSLESSANKPTIPAALTAHQTNLDSYTAISNSGLTSLLSIKNSLESARKSIVSADRSIAEKTASLAELKAGPDALDLRSQELAVQQKVDALADAKENLNDYFLRAPFDGVIAKVSYKKGEEVSSGAAIVTLITKQQTATIALNEVDVAKVKVGQRASLTFDAVEDLTISGEVAEVDSLGTTSQGVVSYNVKIVFDVQDERVKPGMSTSASIVLSAKPDILQVPSAAVKTSGGSSYVEMLENNVSARHNVTVGVSNDLMTEITSGLNEGEEVITQKITTGGTSTSAPAGSNNRGGFMPGMLR